MKSSAVTLLVLVNLFISPAVYSGERGDFDLADSITLDTQPRFPGGFEPFSIKVTYNACRFLLANAVLGNGNTDYSRTLTLTATDLGEGACAQETQTFFINFPNGLDNDILVDLYIDFPEQGVVLQDSVIIDIGSRFLIGRELQVEFSPIPIQPSEPFQVTIFHGHPTRTYRLSNPRLEINGRRLAIDFDGRFLIGGGTGPIPYGPFEVPGLPSGRYALDIDVNYPEVGTVPVRNLLFGIAPPAPIPALTWWGASLTILVVGLIAAFRLREAHS